MARIRFTPDPDAEDAMVQAIVKEVATPLGDRIASTARRLVPKDTWALHDSLASEVEASGAVVTVRVGSNLVYARAVEKGRPDMPNYPVQPYLAPALYQVRDS